MAQDKERKEVEAKERALEEKQVKEGKIRKIACIAQWLAEEDAANTTPRPATSESRGTQKGLPQLYHTESYLQVPRFVLELDIGDQEMDINKNADSHHLWAKGDETGAMTETDVEKPPKKKKKAQDRVWDVVDAAHKGMSVQQSSRAPSSKGRRQGTNRDLPDCNQALVSKKCGNGKDIFDARDYETKSGSRHVHSYLPILICLL
jgi:hypothetical protein